jgi:hypothetical protein
MNRVLTRSLALAAVLAAGATTAGAVSWTYLAPTPQHFIGQCPATITFRALVTASAAGPVKYQWYRSDGATGPIQTIVFPGPGTQTVSTTWTLGGYPGLPSYSGWEALRFFPEGPQGHAAPRPGGAAFTIRCLPPRPGQVQRK